MNECFDYSCEFITYLILMSNLINKLLWIIIQNLSLDLSSKLRYELKYRRKVTLCTDIIDKKSDETDSSTQYQKSAF